jgi:hypothetical protein
MEYLCKVLHHRNGDLPNALPSNKILQLAILAHKYDCMEAMKHAAQKWMSRCRDNLSGSWGNSRALVASAVYFADGSMCKLAGVDYIKNINGPIQYLQYGYHPPELERVYGKRSPLFHALLPSTSRLTWSSDMLEESRLQAHNTIAEFVESTIQSYVAMEAPMCMHGRLCIAAYTNLLMLELSKKTLLTSAQRKTQSLFQLLRNLLNVEVTTGSIASQFLPGTLPCPEMLARTFNKRVQNRVYDDRFMAAAIDIGSRIEAPCLLCVKVGKGKDDDSTCAHSDVD